MTIAQQIKQALDAGTWCAITWTGGCAVGYDGERLLFTTGQEVSCTRNNRGRVTQAAYKYPDDSRLTYKYNPESERWTLKAS